MKKVVLTLVLVGVIASISCGSNEEIPTYEEQLAIDTALIDAYLEENGIDAVIDPSGLRYVIRNEGTGESPAISDRIQVNYEGRYLADNLVFDANDRVTFGLRQLILAWQIALPLLKEGGSMTIYAPSGLCYGPNPQGRIPPNANMIFDLDLISVFK